MSYLDSVTEPSLDDIIREKIKILKSKIGEDVSVQSIYAEGLYYVDKPKQWFGETKRFRVGPCLHVDDVISELTRLHTVAK